MTGHCQHFTSLRIEGDNGTGPVTECSFRYHLQIQIDGEPQIVAGNRVNRSHRADFPAPAVYDDAPHSVLSGKHLIVLTFYAELAPHISRAIVAVRLGDHVLGYLTHVTDNRRKNF